MIAKSKYSSGELLKRKKRILILKSSFYAFGFIVLIYAFVFWFNHPFFNITKIEVSEATFFSSEDIKHDVEEILNEKRFWLLKKSNFLFLPQLEIANRITEENLAVESIKIDLINKNYLKIIIQEYEPRARWCGLEKSPDSDSCYLINRQGVFFFEDNLGVYAENNLASLFSPTIGDEGLGYQYLPAEIFNNLISLENLLEDSGISIELIETEDFETFYYQTGQGPYLKIDYHDSAEDIFNNFQTVLEIEEIHDVQFANLEYMDLRFGNKVYYKIRDPR